MVDSMDMPVGVTVWVPNTDLDLCLETAIKMWLREEPREARCFTMQQKEKRDSRHRDNGMSKEGNWKEYLEIPITLHKRVMKMTHKDYMLDRKITDRLKIHLRDLLPYEAQDGARVIV